MPASPLTIAARQASSRMSEQVFPFIEGNLQVLRQMEGADVVTISQLAGEVAAEPTSPPGMGAGLVADAALLRTVTRWSGNIGVWPQLYAASSDVEAACDFLDAVPAPPILLGITVAIGLSADPLVSLGLPDQPLNVLAVTGSSVRVEGSPWLSINDQTFLITVTNRLSAQFTLNGANTTAEIEGTGAGAFVFLLP
jgi:hypothetical protein